MIVNPGIRRFNGKIGGIPIANRAAHFVASIGITSSSGLASSWADISGNARHLLQATGANQPIHLPYAGTKYGWLPGVAGNYFSTPDSVANSITGDIDIRVKVALADWTPAAINALVGKHLGSGDQRSYVFYVNTNGTLGLLWNPDGTALSNIQKASTAATGFTDGSANYVRATLDVDNGAGGNDVKFYTSPDGDQWTQLGSTVTTAGATSIYDGTATVQLGALEAASWNLNGTIYRAQIYNGIDGTLAVDFDPSRWSSGTTFTASTGETWTINSTGSKPAQIVDRPSLLFDGAAHFMKCAAFTLNQPETIYFVGRQITWASTDTLLDGNAANTGAIIQTTSTPQINISAGSSVAANTEMTLATRKVVCAVFNGASSSLQVTTGTATTGNAGAGNMGGFTLGAAGSDLLFGNIQTQEVLIYSVAHDAATRANIIRALMNKHGIS